jgi:hypothetical protein
MAKRGRAALGTMERPIGKAGSYTAEAKSKPSTSAKYTTASFAETGRIGKDEMADTLEMVGTMERPIGKAGTFSDEHTAMAANTEGQAASSAASPASAMDCPDEVVGPNLAVKEVDPNLEPLEALQDAGIPILLVGGTGIPQCTFQVLAEILGDETAIYLTRTLLAADMGERLDPMYAEAMDSLEFNKMCEDFFGPEPKPATKKVKKFQFRRR